MKRFFRLLKKNEKYWLSGLATLSTYYLLVKIAGSGIPILSGIVLNSFVFVFPIALFYILWFRALRK
jgi:hypothetical protein